MKLGLVFPKNHCERLAPPPSSWSLHQILLQKINSNLFAGGDKQCFLQVKKKKDVVVARKVWH